MLFSRQSGLDQLAGLDLCAIPAGTNPNGQPSNLHNPPSLQPTLIAISAIMMTLAGIVTSGRLFVNRKSFKPADYFMAFGLILDFGICGVLLAASKNYRHLWDTPVCWLDTKYLKLTFVEVLAVGPALFFPKAAIFLFYIQLFAINKKLRIASQIGIAVAFVAYIPASLVLCYYDAPHAGHSWEELLTSGMPEKGIPGGVTIGVASVILDVYIFVLPLPTLYALKLPLQKRIQLIALFATAFMGIVASVICMVFRIKLLGLSDSGWQSGRVAIAIIAENNVAIIVGSMPAFANFLRVYIGDSRMYKSLRSKIGGSSSEFSNIGQENFRQKPAFWSSRSDRRQRRQWHEFSDSVLLKSQVTVPEEPSTVTDANNPGILRTTSLTQDNQARQFQENLA